MYVSTLRPGLLVALKTSIKGNVKYDRVDLEADVNVARWETTRTIADAAEHERAVKARTAARGAVERVCSKTEFGLLCRESDSDKLVAAVAEARRIADEFNATSNVTTLTVNVLTGKVASDDVEAVKSINSEVRDLMDRMTAGLAKFDVKAIRDAADKARDVGKMLSPQAQANVQVAIDAARASAKAIVKAGETAAQEIDAQTIRKIKEQRATFLDLSDQAEIVTPQAQARAIELTPEEVSDAL